jgi:hypothetical protein
MTGQQYDLPFTGATLPHCQAFDAWAHTPAGGQVVNRFIRLAIGFHRRGPKIGAKAIAERLRWNAFCRKHEGEKYWINNSYVSWLARFAMTRAPELDGFFETRQVNKPKSTRPVYIKAGVVLAGRVA